MEHIFPEKIISWMDIVRGVGQVILHSVFDRHRSPTPSEHHFEHPETHEMHYHSVVEDKEVNRSPTVSER